MNRELLISDFENGGAAATAAMAAAASNVTTEEYDECRSQEDKDTLHNPAF